MSNLRVKLILDLVNRMKGPANEARDGLKKVGAEADRLKGKGGAERLKRDMLLLGSDGRKAAGGVREVGAAADRLGRTRGAKPLRDDLKATEQQAKRTAAALAASGMGGASAGAGMGGALAMAGRSAMLPLVGAFGAYTATRATVGQSISFEKAMAEVKKKVDLPEGETFTKLERDIVSMSIALGQSRENVAAVVAEAGAAGTAFKDLAGFTRLATKAGVAWDMPIREAAQKLFEVRSSTGKNLAELGDYVDKVNALGDSSAAKERDILEMSGRSIAAAREAGVSEDTSLAFLTAMRSIGIQPEVGARGFNALVSKMATADETKKVSEGLEMLGLNAKTMAQRMKTDATGALTELFTALDRAKDPVEAAVKIFGQDWFDEMLRTKGSIAEVRKNLEMLRDPSKWTGSAERNLNIELATTASHLERLKALSGEVGDRLGRWALPGINEAIERVIAGMNALDERAAGKKAEETAVSTAADKIEQDQPMTAEARERYVRDRRFRARVDQMVAGRKEDRRNVASDNRLRANEASSERDKLASSIAVRRQGGATEEQLAFSVRRLAELNAEVDRLEGRKIDPRRPADQEERGRQDRGERLALETRAADLAEQVRELRAAAKEAAGRVDRGNFSADASAVERRLRATMQEIVPLAQVPGANFGPGGATDGAGAAGRSTGRAIGSFGFGGGQAIKDAFTIDLGEAGMTMMERLSSGMRQGGAEAEGAAAGVGDAVKARLDAVDGTAAGRQLGTGYANGIRESIPDVMSAINELASGSMAGLARGKGNTLGSIRRALSDGGNAE
jgi:TP901 family phage tail tape measure protein